MGDAVLTAALARESRAVSDAFAKYGKNYKRIEEHLGMAKSASEIREYAQRFYRSKSVPLGTCVRVRLDDAGGQEVLLEPLPGRAARGCRRARLGAPHHDGPYVATAPLRHCAPSPAAG